MVSQIITWLKCYYIPGEWFITFMVRFYYIMVDFYNIYSYYYIITVDY